jgi:hypothetical protein
MLALFQRIGEVEVLENEGSTMEIGVSLRVGDEGALREALRVAARGDVAGSDGGLDAA